MSERMSSQLSAQHCEFPDPVVLVGPLHEAAGKPAQFNLEPD